MCDRDQTNTYILATQSICLLYTPTVCQHISKRTKSRKGSWEKCINTRKSQTYTV